MRTTQSVDASTIVEAYGGGYPMAPVDRGRWCIQPELRHAPEKFRGYLFSWHQDTFPSTILCMQAEVKKTATAKSDGTHVFLMLWKAYRALLADAEASIVRIDLCDSDFRVLEALLHKGPLPVNVIGQMVDLTTGSITSAIDRLESKWFVVRKHHPSDRRLRIVELTTKGRQLIEKAFVQHRIAMEKAVSSLSRAERRRLVDLLNRLGDRNGVARL